MSTAEELAEIERKRQLKLAKMDRAVEQNNLKKEEEKKNVEVSKEGVDTRNSVALVGATIDALNGEEASTNPKENQEREQISQLKTERKILTSKQPASPKEEEASPLTSSFENSMQYFVPHIFAGLAGLITGGGKDALAAISTVDKITRGYYSAKNSAYATEAARKKAISQATKGTQTNLLDEQGYVVYTNGKGEQIRRDGSPAIGKLQHATATRLEKSTKSREDIHKDRIHESELNRDLRKDQFAHLQLKDSELSTTQLLRKDGIQESFHQLDSIDGLIKDFKIPQGQAAGRLRTIKAWFGEGSPEESQLKSQLGFMQQSFRKITTGAQASVQELKMLFELLPGENDPLPTFRGKMNAYREILRIKSKVFENVIKLGQPLKRQTILDMTESLRKAGGESKDDRDKRRLEKFRRERRGKR